MSEFKKCESVGIKYASNICSHMKKSLPNNQPRTVKGFHSDHMSKVSKEGILNIGVKVVYRERGEDVLLNFCPFCGGKLHSIEFGD